MMVPAPAFWAAEGEVGGAPGRGFGPALDGDEAIFGVDSHGDAVTAEGRAGFPNKVDGLAGFRPKNDAADARIEGGW